MLSYDDDLEEPLMTVVEGEGPLLPATALLLPDAVLRRRLLGATHDCGGG